MFSTTLAFFEEMFEIKLAKYYWLKLLQDCNVLQLKTREGELLSTS